MRAKDGSRSKIGDSAAHALRTDGQLIPVGGFGICGIPANLIEAVHSGLKDLGAWICTVLLVGSLDSRKVVQRDRDLV
jgi:acyl CoA:acetate/3-ketoacid CoA transferase alpha subunit